jgi:EmrB/QacA subfamily drug resistance transporter
VPVTMSPGPAPSPLLRYGTAPARWVILVTVLGSGVAFLDATVVNVALPSIGRTLGGGLADLQWIVDAYLLTLGSLIVLGGSLGDIYGRRRVFVVGLAAFAAASAGCGIAPSAPALIIGRAVQGAGGALLVPASLAVLSSAFHPDDRARAIGAWSGLGGAWTALGPFVGGWLIDAVSWRLVFLINLPIAACTVWAALRHLPETRAERVPRHVDVPGAVALSIGLGGVVYALIEGAAQGLGPGPLGAAVAGLAGLAAFPLVERSSPNPMLPLGILRSRQFNGANLTTMAVYGAMGTATFLFVLHLQRDLGYTALGSGVALLPATILMISLSSRVGQLAGRVGPRLPMTVGPIVAGLGLLALSSVGSGSAYPTGILPGVLLFGAGMTLTVAPLTSAVLAAVEDRHLGVGSAINNAVARIASLLSVAALPAVAGLSQAASGPAFQAGYARALVLAAALCACGGLIAFVTIRRSVPVEPTPHAHPTHACGDPCVRRRRD